MAEQDTEPSTEDLEKKIKRCKSFSNKVLFPLMIAAVIYAMSWKVISDLKRPQEVKKAEIVQIHENGQLARKTELPYENPEVKKLYSGLDDLCTTNTLLGVAVGVISVIGYGISKYFQAGYNTKLNEKAS